jgi:hypothetical protein
MAYRMDPNTGVPESIITTSPPTSIYDAFRSFLGRIGPTPIRALQGNNKRRAHTPDVSLKRMRMVVKTLPAKSSQVAVSWSGPALRRSSRLRKQTN